MTLVKIHDYAGSFAENKDKARDIRLKIILPALEKSKEVTVDFEGIDGVTQSFIHALISDLIRKHGIKVLDKVAFKNCNETVRKIITIVSDYMQEGL